MFESLKSEEFWEIAYYASAGIALFLLGLFGAFLGEIPRESLVAFGLKMIGVGSSRPRFLLPLELEVESVYNQYNRFFSIEKSDSILSHCENGN